MQLVPFKCLSIRGGRCWNRLVQKFSVILTGSRRQSPDLHHCFSEARCHRIGSSRSNSLLRSRNASGKSPESDDEGRVRQASAEPLAERPRLTHCKRRQGRNDNNIRATVLNLFQHVLYSSNRDIPGVLTAGLAD